MPLPIVPIQDYPAELNGHLDDNGQLPASVLAVQPGSSPTLTMCKTALRSLLAMDAALHAATGRRLVVTSAPDSYRPLAVQQRIFAERYSPVPLSHRPTRTCNGKTYWLKPGMASAACPGTSNHGLGLACDFVLDSAGVIESWLIAHADEFGFSAELQSEPWHWHYYAGDAIPAATLAYEEDDMAITAADVATIWQTDINSSPTVSRSGGSAVLTTEEIVNRIEAEQKAQGAKLDEILAALAGGTADHTHTVEGTTGPATP